MVFDFDDHCEMNDAMPYMRVLREINPDFKATLFTIPFYSSPAWIDDHPSWIELVPHGWKHPDPFECLHWKRKRMEAYIEHPSVVALGVSGFKAPGWQISDACYKVLLENDWWIADQHLEDRRRPADLPTFFYEDDGNWHGHVQNVCGNGIAETWNELCKRVEVCTDFQFASEAIKVGAPA